MVAIAIFSVDPVLRGNLEQLPREDPAITVVGIVDSPSALLELAETHHVDVVLAETLPSQRLTDQQVRHQQTAWVLILDRADEETSLDALSTGASAILPRTANRREIVTARSPAYGGDENRGTVARGNSRAIAEAWSVRGRRAA